MNPLKPSVVVARVGHRAVPTDPVLRHSERNSFVKNVLVHPHAPYRGEVSAKHLAVLLGSIPRSLLDKEMIVPVPART